MLYGCLLFQVDIRVVNRTSSVALLRWTRRLRLSTRATVVVAGSLAAGLLVLLLLLVVLCCVRRSKLVRTSRRGRRSTDIVCPSPRAVTSPEAGTLQVRGRKPPPRPTCDADVVDWSTEYRCSSGDGESSKTNGSTPRLPKTMLGFGGKSDRLSTYVTFQVLSVLLCCG